MKGGKSASHLVYVDHHLDIVGGDRFPGGWVRDGSAPEFVQKPYRTAKVKCLCIQRHEKYALVVLSSKGIHFPEHICNGKHRSNARGITVRSRIEGASELPEVVVMGRDYDVLLAGGSLSWKDAHYVHPLGSV